jgi:hypothetical protein
VPVKDEAIDVTVIFDDGAVIDMLVFPSIERGFVVQLETVHYNQLIAKPIG